HDMHGPNCRFIVDGTKVDIMPTDETILGFSNRWYEDAIHTSTSLSLPNGRTIRLISPPLFLCTKLEAFFDRGRGDYIASHDLSDIIALVDGRPEIVSEAASTAQRIRQYLSGCTSRLLADGHFIDSIEMHLPPSPDSADRVDTIIERLRKIAIMSSTD